MFRMRTSSGWAGRGWAGALTFLLFASTAVWLSVAGTAARAAQASQEQETEKQEPTEAEAEAIAQVPLVIPEEEKSRENPFKDDKEATALGKKLFSYQCAMCHGPEGRGQGDLAKDMNLTMPDLTSDDVKKKTDGELHYVLSEGHGSMPEHERMSEKNRWSLVNYIRTLGSEEKAPTQE
jgi:mono/diheme cytochrome c family protein